MTIGKGSVAPIHGFTPERVLEIPVANAGEVWNRQVVIRVSHLTKNFGPVTAVDDVSFTVDEGEVVGFLGPNGAGKSTTMRMLTGFLPPTGGSIQVAKRDVRTESLAVRKRIGYLPEKCPLYNDMRVDEYLHYRARLKGMSRAARKRRVKEVKTRCGLIDMERKLIGHLSKGYQQRVGLADALVHEPELLILDEPTQGLDPNQIREVRGLIAELARSHTILLSTHILPEVEMSCQKVIIINQGRIIAADTLANVRRDWFGCPRARLEIRGPRLSVVSAVQEIAGVVSVKADHLEGNWSRLAVDSRIEPDVLGEQLFILARNEGWALRRLEFERQTLEEVFVEVTRQAAARDQRNGSAGVGIGNSGKRR